MYIHYINASETIQKEVTDFITEWNNSSDFITTKTSGSTGKPKEIKIPKKKMQLSAQMTGKFLQLSAKQNALLCLSPNTIAGKMMIVRAMEFDLNLHITDPASNPLDCVNFTIDFIAIVPLQLSTILKNSIDKLRSIKNCIVGGGTISYEQNNQLIENDLTVFQTYGMTETLSHVALRKIGKQTEEFYTALEGNHFSINTSNQLIIHTPLLDFEPLVTNDIVELINTNQFCWKGRTDFVINSGGIKLHPEEMELKLSKLIAIPFFISSLKDELLGEKVILCIESKEKIDLSKIDFIQILSKYEIPKEIYYFEKFEYTESLKINKLKTIAKQLQNAIQQVL